MKTGCCCYSSPLKALCFDSADFKCECKDFFFLFLIILTVLLYCSSASGSPLGPYSLVSTIIRLHAAAGLRDCTHSQNRERTTWKFRVSIFSSFFFFFLVSLLRSLELLLGLCFIIVRIAQESSSPLPPVRLHSQTSRNETRFRPPDRGGTSSAALTCTGRKLRSRTLHFSEKSRGTLFSLSFFFWGGRFKTETGVVM